MGILNQGLILMATGFSAVFIFLLILVFILKGFEFISPRLAHILPDPLPKVPAKKKTSGDSNEALALAIAVALKRAGR